MYHRVQRLPESQKGEKGKNTRQLYYRIQYFRHNKANRCSCRLRCKKDASNSKYVVYDDFSAIYYYTDDGLPRFALFTDKSSVYKKEYRFYLSEGEVIKWVDNDGEEYYGDPQNLPGLYEIALANYSRAMYDCYNKGKYSIQVGCFTDEKDAKACQKSMADLGEDVIVKEIDNAYCVLTRYYFDDWDSASSYGAEMSFSDDCGVIFVRLL